MVNFPTGIPTVTPIILLFWIYLFLSMQVFVLQWISLPWEILIILLSHFPLTFRQIHNRMPHFITQLMTILMLIGTVFAIIWEMFHGRISLNFKLILSVGSGWNWCIYPGFNNWHTSRMYVCLLSLAYTWFWTCVRWHVRSFLPMTFNLFVCP